MAATHEERERRLDKAQRAVDTYYHGSDPNELLDAVTDLLTDLRHWAQTQGIDFTRAEKNALDHYREEVG